MTFDRPAAWSLLALAVPIVVLHLRFRRRRDAEVPSLVLWRDLVPAGTGRRGFRHAEEILQLASVLAALVLFTAALAGPATGRDAGPARRLVIVADVSASVNALLESRFGDAAPRTRFDAIRDAAVAALDRLGPGDEVVVWAASARPRVVVEPTDDLASARAAVQRIAPTLEPSGLRATLDLVRLALGRDDAADVLVLTDAVGAHDLDAARDAALSSTALPPNWRLGVAGASDGSGGDNAAIVAAEVDGSAAGDRSGAEPRLRVRVARTDGAAGRRTLVVSTPRGEVSRAEVEVPELGSAEASLPLDAVEDGGPIVVRLGPPAGRLRDRFPEDDVAVVLLPAPKRLRVALAAPGHEPSRFLVATLRAMPDRVDAERAVLTGPDAPASAFADVDVVIAEGRLPAAAPRDRATLAFGAFDGDAPRTVERPLVWGAGRHAVLDGVDLAPLRIDRANVLVVGPSERVLIECAEGPVAVVSDDGAVRRIRVGFRPDATTLPLEPAFPLLVRNALRWLGRPPILPPAVRAGAPLAAAEPLPPVDRVWISGPGARPARAVTVRGGAIAEPAPLPSPLGPVARDFPSNDPAAAPDGTPSALAARLIRVRGLPGDPQTAVNWFPPDGFRLDPSVPRAPDVASAAAVLPDRRGASGGRTPWASAFAAAGVAALVAGTLFLGRGRPRPAV